ncbi:hypothetical protein D8674_027044 [Pyrus ussuriensis x Pyrus communis]|uniref:Uncharacterized protein n=1 Tax=Pyrus ussuriensis x Pyrus communis TaxID=2448454 RepID=A0A5N5IFY4_9ROSA|nr:hypothetical protein D8674_027044 [Pyrus ussuriensis x Pyrus communis]
MDLFIRLFNSRLQLSESKNLEVVMSNTTTERLRVSKFFLVGKVLSHKYLRPNIVMGVIKDLWRPKMEAPRFSPGLGHDVDTEVVEGAGVHSEQAVVDGEANMGVGSNVSK